VLPKDFVLRLGDLGEQLLGIQALAIMVVNGLGFL
jgi:hypothetical protein